MEFDDIFRSLTGFAPYRWQRALYERMLGNELPDSLPLPTGTGKTSVIPIWLIAQAHNPALPRRLVYVVDRRAIVDQSSGLAEHIAARVGESAELCAALKIPHRELPVSTLRGQHVDNRRWLLDPAAPAIIVGTVDMIGSRLLFGGFGVSSYGQSMHAGILGHDSLIVLDEAHLSQPFASLLKGIGSPTICGTHPSPRPSMQHLVLTATPSASSEALNEELNCAEHEDIAHRLDGEKCLKIQAPSEEKDLADALVIAAWAEREHKRVLVYCDRRDTAVKIEHALRQRIDKEKINAETCLFSGQTRVRERELLATWLQQHGYLSAPEEAIDDTNCFLIATSAGECGVDLDADAMVCDLVPFERMIQRFGRVNRSGQHPATIVTIPTMPDAKGGAKIHYSGANLKQCQDLLACLPATNNGYSASTRELFELQTHTDPKAIEAASTPTYPHPALDRPTVDLWSMTSLSADSEPKGHRLKPSLAPWLHGWEPMQRPQTKLLWRRQIPIDKGAITNANPIIMHEFFQAAPPHLSEILELPSDVATKTLAKLAADKRTTDPHSLSHCAVILLAERGTMPEAISVGELANLSTAKAKEIEPWTKRFAHRTAVVWAGLGGLDSNTGHLDASFGHNKTAKEFAFSTSLDGECDTWDEARLQSVGYRLVILDKSAGNNEEQKPVSTRLPPGWRIGVRLKLSNNPDNDQAQGIAIAYFRSQSQAQDAASAIANRPVTLDKHLVDCEQVAERLAARLGLEKSQQQLLALAGRRHDTGKNRSLWQQVMNAPTDGGPWAKTAGGGNPRKLEGYRHEFGSLMDIVNDETSEPAIAALSAQERDILMHLVAAHHGRSRPYIPAIDPATPPSIVEPQAFAAAQRFERLQRQLGPWQLAWWESLLRAADWSASEQAENRENSQ